MCADVSVRSVPRTAARRVLWGDVIDTAVDQCEQFVGSDSMHMSSCEAQELSRRLELVDVRPVGSRIFPRVDVVSLGLAYKLGE